MLWRNFFALLILHIAGLTLFCMGFFPNKKVLQGYSEFKGDDDDNYQPVFKKSVIMVIDALRSDFMFSEESSMGFVHSLLRSGEAVGFTAFSNPPTVTLPRLKGITTGSAPNFLDAVLNVVEEDTSSTLSLQDSWVRQLKLANKTIHMFGDDTWLKLFPSQFDKVEGTSSFFVSDFTEVDNNVTRHIETEMGNQTWDCLILHYLGLDHIGHKGGPNSVFMKPKQKEMDSIIENVYNNLDEDTVFIVLGDHGMNEIGNHGGSSNGETSAALLFLSKKFKSLNLGLKSPVSSNNDENSFEFYKKIQQIDLVPTISAFLHLPIPCNNLGVIIEEFLPLWDSVERMKILKQNLNQFNKINSNLIDLNSNNEIQIMKNLLSFQDTLTKSATNYNYDNIFIGIILISTVSIFLFISLVKEFSYSSVVYTGFALVYGITSFGSSLVEEEYQYWWWISVLLVLFLFKYDKTNTTILLFLLRILRGWNNSGQKFIGDTFSNYLRENIEIQWFLILSTASIYSFLLIKGGLNSFNNFLTFTLSFILSMLLVTFKSLSSINNGDKLPVFMLKFVKFTTEFIQFESLNKYLLDTAKVFHSMILIAILVRIILQKLGYKYWFLTDIHTLVSFLLLFQTRTSNIPIYGVLIFLKFSLNGVLNSLNGFNNANQIGIITVILITITQLTFYSFGMTNSLANIDLSNSYNGISDYNMGAVGLLMFISNFAGPIYWSFATLSILFENPHSLRLKNKLNVFKTKWKIQFFFFNLSTLMVLVSCYFLRFHLFIWTVFSPKLLFSFAWNLFMNIIVELICLILVALQ